ncbi:MAG: hypothetical protein ACR2IH_12580 [Pyrinomonadaceae bacterium]
MMTTEETSESLDYVKRTIAQADLVERLAKKVKESGDVASAAKLEVEMEKLAYYQNAAKGDIRGRARAAVENANAFVLGRAVTQRLPKLT